MTVTHLRLHLALFGGIHQPGEDLPVYLSNKSALIVLRLMGINATLFTNYVTG
ncbi:MAG: hypothetical protein BMS9Abin09_0319 [Gammaproteobacteria bacterium]|nr:MAG: hypothetical protein BMS9Abin09_0319 [Gammaproteobacteria bacterium]